tara:strand:+ start:97 stop:813 length:717 start_codon:yes stop_codon:yes gene_type:complete
MNDLVIMVNDVPMVNSDLVAKKFNKAHKNVLQSVRKLIGDCPEEFSRLNFQLSTFKTDRGREFECFNMTRDGFSLLAMGFTGKDAIKWKISFIDAFNAMEKTIAKKNDAVEWKQARLQSKGARKSFTDTVSNFVEYATHQGSKSAKMYYMSITKMEYVALELIGKGEKAPSNFRDSLDTMDLSFLSAAEHVAKNAIKLGMNQKLHYKEIYLLAKENVNQYADTVKMPQLKGDSNEDNL